MSYLQSFDNIVRSYITVVSKKYKISETDLIDLWTGKSQNSKSNEPDPLLMKMTKKELEQLCKTRNLKVTGTKTELIERLSENSTSVKQDLTQPSITKKLIEKIPNIEIKKNKFGNYEHLETSLVFDNNAQKIYGKQNSDGSILELTPEDIDLCNKYKFSYILPSNLDKKLNIDDVKVDELDGEEELEEDEFEEEEDEEEDEEDEEEEIEVEEDDFYDDE